MATSPSSKQQSGLSKYGDLKGRLIFLALALVVYRIGAHVPVPGIDPDMLKQLFDCLLYTSSFGDVYQGVGRLQAPLCQHR